MTIAHSLSVAVCTLALVLCGSCISVTSDATAMRQARTAILNGQAECVLIQKNKIVCMERGRGVSPLLSLYEKHGGEMAGGIIVDKVIGRAAAAIAICGKAWMVHGEVISEDAIDFLKAHQVVASGTTVVPRILNRKRDGLCPLEKSVQGITDPAEAVKALKAKVAELKNVHSLNP